MKLIKMAIGATLLGTAATVAIASPAAAVWTTDGAGCFRAYNDGGYLTVRNGCSTYQEIKVKASCRTVAYFRYFALGDGDTAYTSDKTDSTCKFYIWRWK